MEEDMIYNLNAEFSPRFRYQHDLKTKIFRSKTDLKLYWKESTYVLKWNLFHTLTRLFRTLKWLQFQKWQ